MVANANPQTRREENGSRPRSQSWSVPLEELDFDPAPAPPRPLRAVSAAQVSPAVPARPNSPATAWPGQAKPAAIAIGGTAAVLFAYLLISTVVGWLGTKADDLQYGRPRTFQTDAYVGHNETSGNPTHFVAINLNHQVDIIELPGGDVTKARAISGPYLFGTDEDLTPVRLEVRDLNGDAKPDLLVNVKNEQVVYINGGDDFHLMTAAERATIKP